MLMVQAYRELGPAAGDDDAEDARNLQLTAEGHAVRGEFAQALRCYELALLVDENPRTWFNYATLQRRLGLREDAVESYQLALRQDPRMIAARYCLAQLLAELGRPLVALSHFALVTTDKPGHLPAWRGLIELQRGLGDTDAAIESTRRALRHLPGDPEMTVLLDQLERERAKT